MGVYLAIISAADGLYRGSYLWKDEDWRHSAMCRAAGVLSVLSSEVSVAIVCLITLDRFLVLQFPCSQYQFSHKSALVACGMVWSGCLILTVAPLIPGLSHWQYYSQSGICIPLPITRTDFAGHVYSFCVKNVLNSILLLHAAVAQLIIYCHIRTNTICASEAKTGSKAKDLTIARRFLTVAISDFLCWFPVGLLGLLASHGVKVVDEINVAMAIIVLPLNSALNPYLYFFNLLQERRWKAEELHLKKYLMAQRRQQADCQSNTRVMEDILKLTYTKEEVCFLLKHWLHDRLLSKEQLTELLNR